MKIILIRHGETDWNKEKRYLGVTDLSLNETGWNQVYDLKRQLQSFSIEKVYSSPLLRAVQTAQTIGEPAAEVTVSPLLAEFDFALIEGLTYEEAMEQFPDELVSFYNDPHNVPSPGGKETLSSMQLRIQQFIEEEVSNSKGTHQAVAVVTHGGVIRTWLHLLDLAKPFWHGDIPPGSFTCIEM